MNFKITKNLIILSIFLFLLTGCGNSLNPVAETEIKEMCSLLAEKKYQEFASRVLTRAEFEESIYPELPEAKQSSPMPANDYWMLTTRENRKAMNLFLKLFGQKEGLKFEKIGKPLKVKRIKSYPDDIIIYNRIPVYFSDDTGKEIKIDYFFKTVVCTKSECKVWSLGTDD